MNFIMRCVIMASSWLVIVSQELHHMRQVLVGVARKDLRIAESNEEPTVHIPQPTLFVSYAFDVC